MGRSSAIVTGVLATGALLLAALSPTPAGAWASANRYGGHSSGTIGAGATHTNAAGGTTSHAYGVGTEHTNIYGGSSAHGWGGGTEHTNVYGGKTYGEYGAGVAHTTPAGATAYRPAGAYAYPAYHPPVAVPYYAAHGCYGCAAAAGAIVGAAATSAAVASANAAATSNAYAAGVAAGSASTAAAYRQGVNYAALPSGCTKPPVQGGTYYLCGSTWFRPYFGANGVFYQVAPPP